MRNVFFAKNGDVMHSLHDLAPAQPCISALPRKKLIENPGLSRTFQDSFSSFPRHLLYQFQDFSSIFQKILVKPRTFEGFF